MQEWKKEKRKKYLTLKLPGEGQMALPLEILAYGSHKKRKYVMEYDCKFSI